MASVAVILGGGNRSGVGKRRRARAGQEERGCGPTGQGTVGGKKRAGVLLGYEQWDFLSGVTECSR